MEHVRTARDKLQIDKHNQRNIGETTLTIITNSELLRYALDVVAQSCRSLRAVTSDSNIMGIG